MSTEILSCDEQFMPHHAIDHYVLNSYDLRVFYQMVSTSIYYVSRYEQGITKHNYYIGTTISCRLSNTITPQPSNCGHQKSHL